MIYRFSLCACSKSLTDPGCLIEEKPLQTQKRSDHVFADTFCFALGLSRNLAIHIETCVAPVEDLLHQRKGYELFPEKQG